MSPGRDQEYLADGVAEEILNALTRVDGLRVVGRTSSFSFKGKKDDVPSIGRKLGVSTVLDPGLPDGYVARAETRYYNASGRHATARQVLTSALRIAPERLRILRELCMPGAGTRTGRSAGSSTRSRSATRGSST
jgi:hypothetical protein